MAIIDQDRSQLKPIMQRQLLAFFLLGLFYAKALQNCEPPHYFKCKTVAVCIAQYFVCDGENDCGDNSDEIDCHPQRTKPTFVKPCEPNEFQCHDQVHCIPIEQYCDDEPDCMDGSDEFENCHLNKTCAGFKCKNGHCLHSKNWTCDGVNDCEDNSDEENCENSPIAPENCNNTIGRYLCGNKRCISLSHTCDGKDDCGDGSDENKANCDKALTNCKNSTTNSCNQNCAATPAGSKCWCHPGYVLNGTVCEDIDECKEYGRCSQGCRNTIGSFFCQCAYGYKLQDDGVSCKAENGEALMIFAAKSSIRGYYLDSAIYFPIADDLSHVVGVSLDSTYVYWSDIRLGDEAIFRSLEDGTHREVIVTAGLGCPEDIAVDWITGNIYFTDSMYKQVGVCNHDGSFCTVIIKEATEKPRGIALLPSHGKLYWSDWGDNPHISVAYMDGSNRTFFVKDNIGWPNGLTIDYPSSRLYWVDARLKVIESISLDGTDRRTVLRHVATHPYSIAIFENKLYWSDWSTNSIHSCNKFNGKNYTTLFQKNETVYGIHIYHSSLKVKYGNPCVTKPCSQLCLLAANRTYSCACTLDKELNSDKRTCRDSAKRKHIAVAAGNTIIDYYHELLGRPRMSASLTPNHITAMTYDSIADSIIAADDINKSIFRFNPRTNAINHIIPIVNEIVESMAFDYFGNNLYKSNTIHKKIEVHSLTTGEKTEFSYTENPYDIALVPEEGVMFVAFQTNNEFHIDKAQMNGLGSRTHLIEGLYGPKISLAYDRDTKRIYWCDEGTGRIESFDTQGQHRTLFRGGVNGLVSLAVLDNEVFWTERERNRLNWVDKKQVVPGYKGVNLEVTSQTDAILLSVIDGPYSGETHACRKNNGDCSHICLVTDASKRLCACPADFVINSDQKTCRPKTACSDDEIKCSVNNLCIKKIQKCNYVMDCPDGEDEKDCDSIAVNSKCQPDEFACRSGECINKSNRCDSVFNCQDRSDEEKCENHTCSPDEFRCRDGACITKYFVCNGINDCDDFSDEEDCGGHACDDYSFKCNSGPCIPRNWECDGQVDCNDGSDEHDSCRPTDCAKGMFKCSNGRCVDVLLYCNGSDDCDDNSDEADCPENKRVEALFCNKDQFKCKNSTLCIHDTLRCDDHPDCPHHDDEHGCGRCLDETQFSCRNGKCVPVEWMCDNMDDCGDNSDEQNAHCEALKHGPNTTASTALGTTPGLTERAHKCSEGKFACATGYCLPLDMFCDGKEHCLDGSDEGGQCNTTCETNTCENVCHKTPVGPVCSCRVGYELADDEKSCRDVDECKNNVCQQLCENRPGSFVCSCYEGYALRINRVSCKATGPAVKLIAASKDDIRIMSPSTMISSLTIIHRDPEVEITGLDVDSKENTIYWSNEIEGIINKMNIDTKKRVTASNGVGRPETLAVDWITDNVYYFDDKRRPLIKACNVDANKCAVITHIEGMYQRVTTIAIEPLKEMLFWGQVMWKIYEKPSSEIVRSDLMGANQKVIVRDNLGIISGLTIDYHRSILYWSDKYLNSIEGVDFDGKNRKAIVADLTTKPIGLFFYEDSLYWKIEGIGVLKRRHLYGNMDSEWISMGSKNSRLFVVSQISRQPDGPNKCKDRGCEHMCIMHKNESTCICGNGFPATLRGNVGCPADAEDEGELELEDNNHGVKVKLDETGPIVTHAQTQSTERKTGSGTITGLAVTLVTFALMFSVYYYLKKKRPGLFKRRDLSIHFKNPSFARRNNNNNTTTTGTSSILMPGEHEYSNPITEMSNTKLNRIDSGSKKRLELSPELSDGEMDEANTTYHTRLIR
ncbi:vitellogenin receptor isoform X1 [Nasonia vitripennis]|uniref:EGF-like domain-containing protein n=2 Tax=Nasonia vitripennis TaxID=7425 RepID=A0A7M7Q721_NASVI|nr:vitellogenin receptor isoform X1 [Nasonia vitripennis]